MTLEELIARHAPTLAWGVDIAGCTCGGGEVDIYDEPTWAVHVAAAIRKAFGVEARQWRVVNVDAGNVEVFDDEDSAREVLRLCAKHGYAAHLESRLVTATDWQADA